MLQSGGLCDGGQWAQWDKAMSAGRARKRRAPAGFLAGETDEARLPLAAQFKL